MKMSYHSQWNYKHARDFSNVIKIYDLEIVLAYWVIPTSQTSSYDALEVKKLPIAGLGRWLG